jgi:hypothetical protein
MLDSFLFGIEIKTGKAPKITNGTTVASQDLANLPVWVVTHSVDEDYPHNEQARVTSFERIFFHLEQLRLLQY